jgi:hypothetical protein
MKASLYVCGLAKPKIHVDADADFQHAYRIAVFDAGDPPLHGFAKPGEVFFVEAIKQLLFNLEIRVEIAD